MKKKRKFPRDVARFFHVEKSFNETKYVGTHQREKAKERSYIPVKIMAPSMRRFNRNSI